MFQYVCTRDLHWLCNSAATFVHWTRSCTCARLVHQLCNSCAVDTPRWCSRHRSASTRRDQGRRRESRFRCETTVVAHWASASAASINAAPGQHRYRHRRSPLTRRMPWHGRRWRLQRLPVTESALAQVPAHSPAHALNSSVAPPVAKGES